MYAHGKRHSSHRRKIILFFAIVFCLAGYGLYSFYLADTKEVISNNDLSTTRVNDDREALATFNQKYFSISLPRDWQLYKADEEDHRNAYYFKSTKKNNDGRNLVVYLDYDTNSYAVNKVLPVSANNNLLSVGQISDTCANFVGTGNNVNAQADQKLPDTVAKWQNISFLCDLSHANRNAVGTSSIDGINKVIVQGSGGEKHTYFFLYTDHNNVADYTLLVNALKSFQAK